MTDQIPGQLDLEVELAREARHAEKRLRFAERYGSGPLQPQDPSLSEPSAPSPDHELSPGDRVADPDGDTGTVHSVEGGEVFVRGDNGSSESLWCYRPDELTRIDEYEASQPSEPRVGDWVCWSRNLRLYQGRIIADHGVAFTVWVTGGASTTLYPPKDRCRLLRRDDGSPLPSEYDAYKASSTHLTYPEWCCERRQRAGDPITADDRAEATRERAEDAPPRAERSTDPSPRAEDAPPKPSDSARVAQPPPLRITAEAAPPHPVDEWRGGAGDPGALCRAHPMQCNAPNPCRCNWLPEPRVGDWVRWWSSGYVEGEVVAILPRSQTRAPRAQVRHEGGTTMVNLNRLKVIPPPSCNEPRPPEGVKPREGDWVRWWSSSHRTHFEGEVAAILPRSQTRAPRAQVRHEGGAMMVNLDLLKVIPPPAAPPPSTAYRTAAVGGGRSAAVNGGLCGDCPRNPDAVRPIAVCCDAPPTPSPTDDFKLVLADIQACRSILAKLDDPVAEVRSMYDNLGATLRRVEKLLDNHEQSE